MPALGLGYLMAYAKREVPSIDMVFCPRESDLLDCGADVVAVSTTSENFDHAVQTVEKLREMNGATTVLGGVHLTALPQILPSCFDIGVVGEGEVTFVDLLKLLASDTHPSPSDLGAIDGLCFRTGNGQVVRSGERNLIADLDSLPYPDRDGLGHDWLVPYGQTVHMISSRGCPYKCTFCASGRLWKRYRVFSPEYVAGEIEHVRSLYDPREIHFFDDLFIAHRGRFKKFVALLEERGLHRDLVFRSYARADMIDEEMADQLMRMNFRYIDFGIESGCKKILDYLGKVGVTPDVNEQAIRLLADRGISVGVSMIIGSPNETREQMEETYRFLDRNRSKMDRLGVGLLMPLPGTPVWDEAKARGVVSDDMDWSTLGIDFERGDISRCPIMSEHMGGAEMAEVFRRFNHLQHIVNARGEVRRLTDENAVLSQELAALQSEIESLKGSRAVKLALKVRRLVARIRQMKPRPQEQAVEPYPE